MADDPTPHPLEEQIPTSVPDRDPPPSTESAATEPARSGPGTAARFRKGVVRGIGIAAVALFTAFALANRQFVEFGWLFGSTEIQQVSGERVSGGVPLIVLLMVAFALGGVVGAVFVSLRGRARRRASDA